ncbi:hypothetical protein VspSw1_118 [Vibrio phage VspSw_1]|uniref:Uncharacterized protein n=1 Tax=Vibrio phage VspSw_1 TaxID=2484249 RepID=A0A411BKS7_9CAUD|nr:hypothetical protein HOV08_gp118 [Vibrio phage VspSw_1]QAY02186.1 hypothetical protein VspSw1_118 [Vibrio phage VspSw_1]
MNDKLQHLSDRIRYFLASPGWVELDSRTIQDLKEKFGLVSMCRYKFQLHLKHREGEIAQYLFIMNRPKPYLALLHQLLCTKNVQIRRLATSYYSSYECIFKNSKKSFTVHSTPTRFRDISRGRDRQVDPLLSWMTPDELRIFTKFVSRACREQEERKKRIQKYLTERAGRNSRQQMIDLLPGDLL